MIKNARQLGTLIIASLLVIPLFFIYINAEIKDSSAEKDFDHLLLKIRHNNSELSELVLRSRSQLDQQYDSLANSQLIFTDTMTHFKASLLSAGDDMNVHAEVVYSLYEVRMQQLENFKSLNSQIRNSLRYLPKLGQQLSLSNIPSNLLQAIKKIIVNSLNLRLFNDPGLRESILKNLEFLDKNQQHVKSNNIDLFNAFIKHTHKFQKLSKKEHLLISDILNNQLRNELILLERSLTNQHHESIKKTNRIKQYLIFYVVFLLLLIALFTLNRFHLINRALFHKTLSEKDQLTNLHNRRSFIQHLKKAMKHVSQNEKFGALIFIDLDGFKVINDRLGHNAGDEVLKIIAQRLQDHTESIQSPDLPLCVARLGGDEFVVLLEQLNREDISSSTVSFAENIVTLCARELPAPYNNFPISASVGISVFPEHGDDIKSILNCADKAMYYSKQKGKNRFTLYQPGMHQDE